MMTTKTRMRASPQKKNGNKAVKAPSAVQILRAVLCAALLGGICLAGREPQVDGPSSGSSALRSVEGVVTSTNGQPVEGAVVLLKDSKTLQVRSFITLKDGSYHFYGLGPDVSYDVRATHGDESSANKTVSSYNGKKKIVLNLKLK
jgi:hypothetical protein